MFIEFRGKSPKVATSAFVAPTAVLIGDVEVGEHASIWFGVILRADNGPIRIGARSNVQDNSVVHVSTNGRTIIGDDCSIGHSVTMEDCSIGDGSLVGSNAVVLNGSTIGPKSLIAAGSVVPNGADVPAESLVAGVPGVVKRKLDESGLKRIAGTSAKYVALSREYGQTPAASTASAVERTPRAAEAPTR